MENFIYGNPFRTIILFILISGLASCTASVPRAPTEKPFSQQREYPGSTQPPADGSGKPQPTVDSAKDPDQIPGNVMIAYEKSGDIWASIGSKNLQITSSGSDSIFKLSYDGEKIIFTRNDTLYVTDRSGSDQRKLANLNGAIPFQGWFDPGGKFLYFTTTTPEKMANFDLQVVDLEKFTGKTLLSAGLGGYVYPSPEWNYLALAQPGKLSLYDVRTNTAKLLFGYQIPAGNSPKFIPPIVWQADGYGFKTIIPGFNGKPSRFMFIPAGGTKPAQLAEFTAESGNMYISPDGTRVAYLKLNNSEVQLHVIDASTADKLLAKRLGGNFGIWGWSPDSKYVLVWLDVPENLVLTDGITLLPLSDSGGAEQVIWINNDTYLYIHNGELRWKKPGKASVMIDSGVSEGFDVVTIP